MLQAATTGRIPLSALPGEPTIETDDGAELPVAALWQEVPAKTRLAAAERVLDRIHGKAPLSVDVSEDAAAVLSAILRDKG